MLGGRATFGWGAAVVEGTEERQHLWIRDGDAALAVADAEIPGPEVLRRRRGGEDQHSRHEQQPEHSP